VQNGTGINIFGCGATVERNYVSGVGISVLGAWGLNATSNNNSTSAIVVVEGSAIILNNTITNSGAGITLYSPFPTTTINYNNIQANNKSIVLGQTTPSNINATYNWWGTTDPAAINQSIYDNKNDFNLGTVNFVPFLPELNPQAMPDSTVSTTLPSTSPTSTPTPTLTTTPTATPNSTTTTTPEPQASTSPSTLPTPSTTPQVPEFPSPAILAILTIATLASVAIYKTQRRLNQKGAN
jgi:hypothetical protein